MEPDRGVVRRAAQLVAISEHLRQDGLGHSEDTPRPISWPGLTPDEATEEWPALRQWVERLIHRYPNMVRLPDCWWRHNDLVEVLSALRDFERACFATAAPATGPVEWQRAMRDMEIRIEIWTKRFTCNVPGRGHDTGDPSINPSANWDQFIAEDVDHRRSRADLESSSQRV